MEAQMSRGKTDPKLEALVLALIEMRDAWAQVSIVLKDYFAEMPSPIQREVLLEVEQLLANIRTRTHGDIDRSSCDEISLKMKDRNVTSLAQCPTNRNL